MALGQHIPRPSKGKTNTFKPQENCGKPLLVIPREFQAGFESDKYEAEGPRDIMIVDYVDLSTAMTPAGLNLAAATIIPTVMTGSAGIRDDLKRYVPGGTENQSADEQILAYKIEKRHNPKSGFDFYVLVPLEGAQLQLAIAWEATYGIATVQKARATYEAQAAAAAPPAGGNDQVAALQAQLAALQAQAAGQTAPATGLTAPAATPPAAPTVANPGSAFDDEKLAAAIAGLNLQAQAS
jgi:hypothetical protein